jgi:hypothetical protein
MAAFLEYGRVVNDQHSVAAPDELICLNQQFSLHRGWIPDPSRDKMVQLIVTAGRSPLGHRLNALADSPTIQRSSASHAGCKRAADDADQAAKECTRNKPPYSILLGCLLRCLIKDCCRAFEDDAHFVAVDDARLKKQFRFDWAATRVFLAQQRTTNTLSFNITHAPRAATRPRRRLRLSIPAVQCGWEVLW